MSIFSLYPPQLSLSWVLGQERGTRGAVTLSPGNWRQLSQGELSFMSRAFSVFKASFAADFLVAASGWLDALLTDLLAH